MPDMSGLREAIARALELAEKGQPDLGAGAMRKLLEERRGEGLAEALVLDGLGRLWARSGDYASAMSAFGESLAIMRLLFSENRIEPQYLQGALQNLAHARFLAGDFSQAARIGREAVAVAEKAWGGNSPRLAEALFHCSAPFYAMKDYAGAENILLRAKAILDAAPDGPYELAGTILNNLGRISEETGKNEDGIAWHRQAVALRRALPNRDDLAFSLGNLGVALAIGGHREEACAALRECLGIYDALGRADSPEARAYADNLALIEG